MKRHLRHAESRSDSEWHTYREANEYSFSPSRDSIRSEGSEMALPVVGQRTELFERLRSPWLPGWISVISGADGGDERHDSENQS